jgi:RHS repeat-associated protein
VVANSSGSKTAEVRYKAWGEDRYTSGTAPTIYRYTGQRVETSLGLYYYGARWYDPALGRFVQADTVVASMGDPQAWDRYAYVDNNPVRYTDPDGHRECEGGQANDCGFMPPKTVTRARSLLKPYGVSLEGDWRLGDAYAAYVGVDYVASALSPYTGVGGESSFKQVFGPMLFITDMNLGKWFARTSNGLIRFSPGNVTPRLTAHELGHAFEKHIWAQNGGTYANTNNPVQVLATEGIYDANENFVTGKGNRNNGLYAPINGYWSDNYQDEWQWHPRNMEGGNNNFEDWADIFLNWAFNSFVPNPAGTALYNWVDIHMNEWVK